MKLQENLHVQRFSACLGVVAMLVALLTAPLFHSHDHDDHGTPASIVHAHLLETHEAASHPDDEMELPHGHNDARWIDYFTFQPPSVSLFFDVDFTDELTVPLLAQREGVVLASPPRAHSPPDGRLSAPRSPPTI